MSTQSRTRRWASASAMLIAIVAGSVACSGDDDSSSASTTTGTTTDASTDVSTDDATSTSGPAAEGTEPVTSTTSGDGENSVAPTTTTSASGPVEEPMIAGAPKIELEAPLTGAGHRPLLRWSTVEGADSYLVVLTAPDGSPYWGTSTAATEIYVGGPGPLREDAPGPAVSEGMTWSVTAWTSDGEPLAASGRRPISP